MRPCETLPRLVERMGSMGNLRYGHWESRMSDGELIGIAPHLMSLLDTWIRRERAPVALQLIFGFGCRVKAVDLFIDLLVDLTHDKRGNVARSGLEALTRLGLRKRAAELIPRLVRDDPSWIQVSAVSWHLHLHRQDLLTPFLSARVYKGRFPSGKAAFLPAFDSGFSRWTAAQQQCYADELVKILPAPSAMPGNSTGPSSATRPCRPSISRRWSSLRAWTRLTRGCATRRWRRSGAPTPDAACRS